MNDLTQAIKEIGIFENNITTPLTFYGKDEEDPYEFIKQFNRIGKINRQNNKRKLEIVANLLKGQASYWFEKANIISQELKTIIVEDVKVTRPGFEEEFLKKYITREKRNTWYRQLEEIQ